MLSSKYTPACVRPRATLPARMHQLKTEPRGRALPLVEAGKRSLVVFGKSPLAGWCSGKKLFGSGKMGRMTTSTLWLLCFLIGCVTGLRTMMGITMICWGAHLGWLHVTGTKLGFLANPISLVVFSLLAIGELVADKLPVPPRIETGPLLARVLFGGICGMVLALAAGHPWPMPALVGIAGALAGAFAGYWLRRAITTQVHIKDLLIAPVEDAVAILVGLFVVSRPF
jgi:uncharacterized membrane protein